MRILLDTASFWWIATGSSQLSSRAAEAFSNSSNEVAVSPISIWELLVKHQLGKLPTTKPISELLVLARNERDVPSLPVRESAVMRLANLPNLHRDPFDRLLICQALDEGMTLLTPDEQMHRYPVPTLW